MDPISAIANAASALFDGVFGWLQKNTERKTAIAVGQYNLAIEQKMTDQEKIKYNEAVQNGNTLLASKLLDQAQSRIDNRNTAILLIIGGIMAAIIVMIVAKTKKK